MSQEFDKGPRIRQDLGDQFFIAYDFELDGGAYAWDELSFTGVVAFRFTSVHHCSEDQVSAYDKLQEVTNGSSWITATVDAPPGLRHYRIYFDDVGCYEALATAFVPPFEE